VNVGVTSAVGTNLLRCDILRGLLQRLFSIFPGSWPGFGLFILRFALATFLFAQGSFYLASWSESGWVMRSLGISGLLVGGQLLIGYLTPLASAAATSITILCMLCSGRPFPDAFSEKLNAVIEILTCLAMLCLGPGAFSIDSRLFGRREIVFRNTADSKKSLANDHPDL
jgi:uncharacterized membrane protein YphA (DoxX/SURF4 family)